MERNEKHPISLLYPNGSEQGFKVMTETALHDLGFDLILSEVTPKEQEQQMMLKVLAKMTKDPKVTKYRLDVFEDIYKNPDMCEEMMKILDKINFLYDYGAFKKKFDEATGVWDLMHRLEEINEYIGYVEAIYQCLSAAKISSEGLIFLKEYVDRIYHDNGYEALKKDIKEMKASTSELKSLTVGINLNERFEADGMGLISVNNKYFTKSNVIGNFYDKISSKGEVKEGTDWDGAMKYHPVKPEAKDVPDILEKLAVASMGQKNMVLVAQVAKVPIGDSTQDITHYMDRTTNQMLSHLVRKLRETLNKYMLVTITDITNLIPEFSYYIRFAEYVKKLEKKGFKFSKPQVAEDLSAECMMKARGVYNLKLATAGGIAPSEIVTNDLDYDKDHLVYILTGANRGGKTTFTQALGQLFVLAQGGIFIPGESFEFVPADSVYTHFPADEDKTMDLGRLGEECKRFKELYLSATKHSLLLLNETFSTTSFEEGYFIARDSMKAILQKQIRTLYNTHMHKLAYDVEELNKEMINTGGEGIQGTARAASLVVRSETGQRSFKVELAPPEGMSYARDIAEKYGVTYEMLTADPS